MSAPRRCVTDPFLTCLALLGPLNKLKHQMAYILESGIAFFLVWEVIAWSITRMRSLGEQPNPRTIFAPYKIVVVGGYGLGFV